MMKGVKKIYGGRLGRKALVRPLGIISASVVVGAVGVYYTLISCLFSWDREDIALAKQDAIERGDAELKTVLERSAELLNIGYLWAAFLALVVAYAVWLLLTSPYWVRRMRDAGVNMDWFAVAFVPVIPMVYFACTMENPVQIPYDAALQSGLLALGVLFVSFLGSVGILGTVAFRCPSVNRR